MSERDRLIFAIVGPGGSGKSTLFSLLDPKIHKALSYTTRCPRAGEKDKKDYNFVSEEHFKKLLIEGKLICVRSFYTECGLSYYGFAKDDFEDTERDVAVVIDPNGLSELQLLYGSRVIDFQLFVFPHVARQRMLDRGDDMIQVSRRLSRDALDFTYTTRD